MTRSHAQQFVAKLARTRREGESDYAVVHRHERRRRIFALLSCGLLLLLILGRVVLQHWSDTIFVWVAVVAFQIFLWLRTRQVRHFLEHDTTA